MTRRGINEQLDARCVYNSIHKITNIVSQNMIRFSILRIGKMFEVACKRT